MIDTRSPVFVAELDGGQLGMALPTDERDARHVLHRLLRELPPRQSRLRRTQLQHPGGPVTEANEQLQLPSVRGYESRHFKTTISGSISDPKDQSARAFEPYEVVTGIFVGEVGHGGIDATYIGKDKAPVYTTKINVSQILRPLSDTTRQALINLRNQIYEENARAALGLGLVSAKDAKEEAAEEAKAS